MIVDKKKAYFNDVKGLIVDKVDIISMRMTTDNQISDFDLELLEMAIGKLKEYNDYIGTKDFAESIVGITTP